MTSPLRHLCDQRIADFAETLVLKVVKESFTEPSQELPLLAHSQEKRTRPMIFLSDHSGTMTG
ncbi:hypothetical protein B1H26_02705 [Amycolatopsis sp. BJA-103]|nr:hypothetical protein BKN51_29730 [Amycolatopsis sp. BJA-103]PNE20763.1 hypothetical protein B1H26_02705 [Amycolatopsis sp. BJA-103]